MHHLNRWPRRSRDEAEGDRKHFVPHRGYIFWDDVANETQLAPAVLAFLEARWWKERQALGGEAGADAARHSMTDGVKRPSTPMRSIVPSSN